MSEGNGHKPNSSTRKKLALTSLTALGVVFGDIGTSPLYAFRMCFSSTSGISSSPENVMGVMSLVFWAITVVITIKYLLYILLADLNGEGGVLALMALALGGKRPQQTGGVLVALGLAGAALLYGDGMITPAISVLSAVDGIAVATPKLAPLVIPLSLLVLIGLFMLQSRGTKRMGALFGPVMLLWFGALAVLGIFWILKAPQVLWAVDPRHALHFFIENGWMGFFVLGFVFLVVTGGEALYADLGHFGLKPIRMGWFWAAMPGVLLNYFGQAALLLKHPELSVHTFYSMAPGWFLYPLVALATLAAIIASQAVISGAFSLTYQAVRLGFIPRLAMKHYAEEGEGQVYVPFVNFTLMVASCLLVLGFRSSDSLAGAYGLAVSATMVITTLLAGFTFVKRSSWFVTILASAVFLVFDAAFLAANLTKMDQGGWFPALMGVLIFSAMTTWATGRRLEEKRLSGLGRSAEELLETLQETPPVRTPGTGVFMDSRGLGIPRSLAAYYHYTHCLPEHVVLMTVMTDPVPRVSEQSRTTIQKVGTEIVRVNAHYGFMQTPNVPKVLRGIDSETLDYISDETTFFVGRQTAQVTRARGMLSWRKALYAFLTRNAEEPIKHYHLPSDRVLEIGVRFRL